MECHLLASGEEVRVHFAVLAHESSLHEVEVHLHDVLVAVTRRDVCVLEVRHLRRELVQVLVDNQNHQQVVQLLERGLVHVVVLAVLQSRSSRVDRDVLTRHGQPPVLVVEVKTDEGLGFVAEVVERGVVLRVGACDEDVFDDLQRTALVVHRSVDEDVAELLGEAANLADEIVDNGVHGDLCY